MIIAVSRIGKRPQSGSTDVKIADHGRKLEISDKTNRFMAKENVSLHTDRSNTSTLMSVPWANLGSKV